MGRRLLRSVEPRQTISTRGCEVFILGADAMVRIGAACRELEHRKPGRGRTCPTARRHFLRALLRVSSATKEGSPTPGRPLKFNLISSFLRLEQARPRVVLRLSGLTLRLGTVERTDARVEGAMRSHRRSDHPLPQ